MGKPIVTVTLNMADNPLGWSGVTRSEMLRALRAEKSLTGAWLADQIEAQTKPPKPAEPTGLGAVVEDADGMRWVQARAEEYPWRPSVAVEIGAGPLYKPWDQIDAVRVLSEGVPA